MLKTLIYPASGIFCRCSWPSFMKKTEILCIGELYLCALFVGMGSVILLLIGKFVGIMFIAFVGVLLDDIFNSVGEDAFTKKAAKGGRA